MPPPRGNSRVARSAFARLRARELGRANPGDKIFSAIPGRLATPVESLLDGTSSLLRCVVLGFTADGDHLLSYASSDGEHSLQVWGFRLGEPATLIATTPLFQTAESPGSDRLGRGDDGESALLGDVGFEDSTSSLRITACESPDASVLVIHGEPTAEREFGSSEAPMARRCFITAMPSPCARGRAAAAAAWGGRRRGDGDGDRDSDSDASSRRTSWATAATHASYLSTSSAPFAPAVAGVIAAEEIIEEGDSDYEEEEEEGGGESPQGTAFTSRTGSYGNQSASLTSDAMDATDAGGSGSGGSGASGDENVDANRRGRGGFASPDPDAFKPPVARYARRFGKRTGVSAAASPPPAVGRRTRRRRAWYVVVNAGDSLLGVRLVPRTVAADARREEFLSFSPGPIAPVRWTDANANAAAAAVDRRRVVDMRAWTALESDAVLSKALAATLRLGYSIVDYELHVLSVAHAADVDAAPSVVAVVVSVLQARGERRQMEQRAFAAAACAPSTPWRIVASVVECPLAAFPPPPPRLLYSVEVDQSGAGASARAKSAHHGSAGVAASARAIAIARARLTAFRRAAHVPTRRAMRCASVSSNANVANGGASVPVILHPTMPLCVLGYGRSARARGRGDDDDD